MPSPRARLASTHAHWRARKTAHRRARDTRTVVGRGDRRQSGLASRRRDPPMQPVAFAP